MNKRTAVGLAVSAALAVLMSPSGVSAQTGPCDDFCGPAPWGVQCLHEFGEDGTIIDCYQVNPNQCDGWGCDPEEEQQLTHLDLRSFGALAESLSAVADETVVYRRPCDLAATYRVYSPDDVERTKRAIAVLSL